MKMKKMIFTTSVILFACLLHAQRMDKQHIFAATSEEEVYTLFDQILDSTIYAKKTCDEAMYQHPSVGPFHKMENKDTVLVFEQMCSEYASGEYICNRISYFSRLSNCMPLEFYERFLDYLEKLSKSSNYYAKECAYEPLYPVQEILIKQYESGKLSKNDSLKVWNLIQLTTIRIINEKHSFYVIPGYYDFFDDSKYMTDDIRQALIREIENPFYPTEYLDSYMSQQDTACIDTTGIPPTIRPKWKVQFTPEELLIYEKEVPLYRRLRTFLIYEKKGREKYNGLSAGQAYLQEKKDKIREKGYLDINIIAEYAHKKQDELLIKHLKAFKKKHPDYPLKYF
jgi:hypothetical protein